jgi:hypothetical protein
MHREPSELMPHQLSGRWDRQVEVCEQPLISRLRRQLCEDAIADSKHPPDSRSGSHRVDGLVARFRFLLRWRLWLS